MKKIYSVYVTETLQRECEIEAESEECTNCCEDNCILFRIERILGNHE